MISSEARVTRRLATGNWQLASVMAGVNGIPSETRRNSNDFVARIPHGSPTSNCRSPKCRPSNEDSFSAPN
ncbi:unnamed protein product, partial [Iphiclides podalirius]